MLSATLIFLSAHLAKKSIFTHDTEDGFGVDSHLFHTDWPKLNIAVTVYFSAFCLTLLYHFSKRQVSVRTLFLLVIGIIATSRNT